MSVTYGADYSAAELSPSDLDKFKDFDLRFLIRYIGWPENRKCISHYPGAYERHVGAGRRVLLVAEHLRDDPAGGHAGGVAMARRALKDARSIGYPDHLPIFFCADAWLAEVHIPPATAMAYLDGAASVMGRQRTGAYGFRDFIKAAKSGGHARWLWLAGSAPTDHEVAEGWPHFYQRNNGRIRPGGVEADLNWAYPGVLKAVYNGQPPSGHIVDGHHPPAWPLPPGHYFGLITGPEISHGGYDATERGWVRQIQQCLIRKGFVHGIQDPNSGWADGKYEEPTRQAVLGFQRSIGHPETGIIRADDWARLLA